MMCINTHESALCIKNCVKIRRIQLLLFFLLRCNHSGTQINERGYMYAVEKFDIIILN